MKHLRTGKQAEILDYHYFKLAGGTVVTDVKAEVFDFSRRQKIPFTVKAGVNFANGKKGGFDRPGQRIVAGSVSRLKVEERMDAIMRNREIIKTSGTGARRSAVSIKVGEEAYCKRRPFDLDG